MNVKFSVHAVERYIERVRPGLCFGDASGELSALMEHAEVSETPPEWHGGGPEVAWLLLSDDVAFPLCRTRGSYLLATTCDIRGTGQRTKREIAERREAKRKARELRRWRRNRKSFNHGEAA